MNQLPGPSNAGVAGVGGQDGGALGSDAENDGAGPGGVARASGDRNDGLLWAQPFGAADGIGSRAYSGSATATPGSVNYALNIAHRLALVEETHPVATEPAMTTLLGCLRSVDKLTVNVASGPVRYAFNLEGAIPGKRGAGMDRYGPFASAEKLIINGHLMLWNVNAHGFDMIPIFEDTPNALEPVGVPLTHHTRQPWSMGKIAFSPEFMAAHDTGFSSYRARPANRYIWPTIQIPDALDRKGGGNGTWKDTVNIWEFFQQVRNGLEPADWDAIRAGQNTRVGPPEHNANRLAGPGFWDVFQVIGNPPEVPPGGSAEDWEYWRQWTALMGAGVAPDQDGGSKMKFAVACGSWLMNFLPTIKIPGPAMAHISAMQNAPLLNGVAALQIMPDPPSLNFPFMGSMMVDPCLGMMCMRYAETDDA